MSHTPPSDYDVVDLALDFADLSISIRGPPSSAAAAFVRNLSATSSDISSVALPSQAIANLVTLWLLHLRPRKLQRPQLDRRVAPALHPPFHLFLRVGFVLLLAWVSRTYQQKDGYVELGQQGVGLELWCREACSLANRYWVVVVREDPDPYRIFTSSRRFFAAVGCHGPRRRPFTWRQQVVPTHRPLTRSDGVQDVGVGILQHLAAGFQPYVLELPVSGDPSEGVMLAMALVVFRRRSGVTLAVPEEFIAPDTLAAGMLAGPDDTIGPSQVIQIRTEFGIL